MKSSIHSLKPSVYYLFATLIALLLAAPPARGQPLQCVETNGVKFLLPPQVDGGWDVRASRNGIVLADDFYCNTTGPITDIHVWGSWLSDLHGTVTNFWLGIYNDVPAVTNFLNGKITPSHPGTMLLWQQSFGLGQYAESIYGTGSEQFFDPSIPNIVGSDTAAWYYCFYPTNPFVQQGTATSPTNYWLALRAQLPSDPTLFGWKTSLVPYNDAAVWGTVDATGKPSGDWQSMTNIQTHQPINLAFKLTTPTNNTPPPTGCVETNGVKYVQWPNVVNGIDVWNSSTFPPGVSDGPWVLADDFVCTNTGPITDIHIWGSWWYDYVATNSITFWIGIFDDVPASPPTGFSHPGALLWEQCFSPGQYSESLWSSAQETFLDPGVPQNVGTDTKVWYYCFYPTNPPVQYGTPAARKTYWLAVYAQLPAGATDYFGWKTTTNVQNDESVHAIWNLPYCPNNLVGQTYGAWTPTYTPSGLPLDLAFKLTTPTNQCPVPIACPLDKTVECGASWSFDPPTVGPDQCCPVPPLVTFNVVTNNIGPCQQSYTAFWTVTDCAGVVLKVCPQTVTVVDTNAPVLSHCGTNFTVTYGTPWTFTQPTAQYLCSGSNVFVGILSSNLFNLSPCNSTNAIVWSATNQCNGLFSTCTQVVTVVCPPTGCLDTNGIKYVQWPNTLTGYDVWNSSTIPPNAPAGPWVLADDFICTNTGYITDIHLWGSWWYDQIVPNSITFWIGLFDDVSTNANNPYSHPGNLFWSQCFAPGEYSESFWSPATENFLDPGLPGILGSDSQVWYYCFFPSKPPLQRGLPYAHKTYWLAVYAQLPSGLQNYFGWKTTTNVQHDISVHSKWPFGSCPTNLPQAATAWQPTRDVAGLPLDLAFEITTATNCASTFITIDYPATNIVVLTWPRGILQVSTNVIGTYVDVPGAVSPYTNTTLPMPPTNRFYRVRCP